MIIWDKARTTMQRLAQDTSSDGLEFLESMANVGYKQILADFGRQQTEIESTINLVGEQRGIQMPADCLWPKTVILLQGSTRTPLTEEASDKKWGWLTYNSLQGQPSQFHYRPRFGIGGGILELNPIPSGTQYAIELTYEATDKDLSKSVYTTGTVTLTHDSADVTGAGTTFTVDMIGRYLQVTSNGHDRIWRRINRYTSPTKLVLENVYDGSTEALLDFQIAETFNLPEDMHVLPIYFAVWHHWESKKDKNQADKFLAMYKAELRAAKKRYSVVMRDNIINQQMPVNDLPQYPSYYPTEIV